MGKIVYSFDKDIPYVMTAVTPQHDTIFRFAGNTTKTVRPQIALDPGQSAAMDFPAFAFGADSLLSISAGMAGYPRSTVSLTTSMTDHRLPAQPIKKNVSLSREIITFSASTKTLSIYIPKAQTVSVSAYVVNGQQISQLSRKKFMSAGTHTINLAKSSITNGVIVFRIDGSNFSCVKKINLTTER
jgi:hypothetical protein